MSFIKIDGAIGEGGGQVLRTALSLSIITQQAIEIVNIRAKRKRPGLLRQHLTSVLAAQEICDATTEGVELGASRILFTPGSVKAGNYDFSIGTAGSTVLVCQTILPVLMMANGPSTVSFEGGTHNGMSPSLCFLKASFLPILAKMGVKTEVKTSTLGFYPAGGGRWKLTISPVKQLRAITSFNRGADAAMTLANCSMQALVSQLPTNIGEREIKRAKKMLNWQEATASIRDAESQGPGNTFQLRIDCGSHVSLFEVVGELGLSAENVAKRCVGQVRKYMKSTAAVEEHLADQLLLPFALAGSGSYTTTKPSLHTLTNIDIIKRFLDIDISIEQVEDALWQIRLAEYSRKC